MMCCLEKLVKVYARFVELCRTLGFCTEASVAIDGSKFKAFNNRDQNFTRAKMERRLAQIEDCRSRRDERRQRPLAAFTHGQTDDGHAP